jgi:hypothetical protein
MGTLYVTSETSTKNNGLAHRSETARFERN